MTQVLDTSPLSVHHAFVSHHPGGGGGGGPTTICTTPFTNISYLPKSKIFEQSHQHSSPGGKEVCTTKSKSAFKEPLLDISKWTDCKIVVAKKYIFVVTVHQ